MNISWKLVGAAGGALFMLAACGEKKPEAAAPEADAATVTLANGMTAAETIEMRQGNLKEMGKAFKTIADATNSADPDFDAIRAAADTVADKAAHIGEWFPQGSSAAAGVETDALDAIWEKPDDFAAAVTRLQGAAPGLQAAAQSDDIDVISAAFKETGGACKNCHDSFRHDDD